MKHLELDESVLLLPGNIKAAAAAWKLCLDWRGWNVWASRDAEPGARSAAEGQSPKHSKDNQAQRGQWGVWQLPPGAWSCSASLSALVGDPHASEVSLHRWSGVITNTQPWAELEPGMERMLRQSTCATPLAGNERVPHPIHAQVLTDLGVIPRLVPLSLVRPGCGLTRRRTGGCATRGWVHGHRGFQTLRCSHTLTALEDKAMWKVGHKMSWPGLMGPEEPRVVSALLALPTQAVLWFYGIHGVKWWQGNANKGQMCPKLRSSLSSCLPASQVWNSSINT